MFSPFLTQRTKSKFVISKEGNVAETLYKFIKPEDVPVQYGGLSRPGDLHNDPPKPASEFSIKGGEKVNIQIEGIEAGATITWDIVVGGWEVEYSAEFVPNSEGSYTIAVEKSRKVGCNEEAIHNSYTAREGGKMVLSVDNSVSRRRKVAAYRLNEICFTKRLLEVEWALRPAEVRSGPKRDNEDGGDGVRTAGKDLISKESWIKEFGADSVVEEDLGFKELEGVVAYMQGFDREGHPVCYNAYGVFKDKELYEKVFGDDEKLNNFLRWRVQVLERGINLLHFKPNGVNSIIQVTDMKDMPKKELRVASNHIFVLYSMFSPFLTQRTKSKFVISKEGNVAETLYKFIKPEDVPVQCEGLSRPGDLHNDPPKPASEFSIKGGEKVNIQIEGIEVECSAEFVPNSEGSYTIAVEKSRKVGCNEEAIHNSYTAREGGKMVLSVDNSVFRRRKVAAYRVMSRASGGF
ncbi:PATL6 [Linum grandiflorum]